MALLNNASEEVSLVGKGNANIVLSIGDDSNVYRLSIRYKQCTQNNKYTIDNWKFLLDEVKPLLRSYLCPIELVRINVVPQITRIYSLYVSLSLYNQTIFAFKLPNLKPKHLTELCYHEDHQIVLYSNASQDIWTMEMKPKWLHNPVSYCRNCTHNRYKWRNIKYCIRKLLCGQEEYFKDIFTGDNIPPEKLNLMAQYFSTKDNILKKLYLFQFQVYSLVKIGQTDNLPLLMTLRDVSVFIKWEFYHEEINDTGIKKLNTRVKVSIVDVDLKPDEKRQHWINTENTLNSFPSKVYH